MKNQKKMLWIYYIERVVALKLIDLWRLTIKGQWWRLQIFICIFWWHYVDTWKIENLIIFGIDRTRIRNVYKYSTFSYTRLCKFFDFILFAFKIPWYVLSNELWHIAFQIITAAFWIWNFDISVETNCCVRSYQFLSYCSRYQFEVCV